DEPRRTAWAIGPVGHALTLSIGAVVGPCPTGCAGPRLRNRTGYPLSGRAFCIARRADRRTVAAPLDDGVVGAPDDGTDGDPQCARGAFTGRPRHRPVTAPGACDRRF